MRRLLVLALLGAWAAGLVACGDGGEDPKPTISSAPVIPADGEADEAARLEAARVRWAASGIESYRWTFTRRCFCEPWETRVRVVDGEVARFVTNGEPGELDFRTMEQLFDVIEAEIDRSDTVTVAYDESTGQVETADFDRLTNAADDELGYTVDRFVPLRHERSSTG